MRRDNALSEKRVFENLDQRRTFFRDRREDGRDEVLDVDRDGSFWGEFVLVVADAFVDGFDVFGLERGFTDYEGV